MNFLVIQETDWLHRGPHIQHHLFERLSLDQRNNITVFDFDIDRMQKSSSLIVKRTVFPKYSKIFKDSRVNVIRSWHIQLPWINRISALIADFFEFGYQINRSRPDIIFNYAMSNGIYAFLYAKLYRIPFVFHYIDILHELLGNRLASIIGRAVSKFLLQHADEVIIHNPSHRNHVINYGVNPRKIQIIRTGISLENTIINSAKLETIRAKLGIMPEDFVIFFMGYLYDFAGLKEIIQFYDDEVKAGKLKLKFIIVGDGGIYEELKKYIAVNNVSWAIMTGRVPYKELAEYIELADLCLQSFKINEITSQAAPIKIYEYMAQKKPTLSTKLPGIYSELGDNHGVLFVRNQKELISQIARYSRDRESLSYVGQQAFEYAQKFLRWDIILADFKKLLVKILERNAKKKNLDE